MSSANNADLFGKVSRIFNPPPTDADILKELAAKDPEIRNIVEAAMAVYANLGHGFLVPVYCQAMDLELEERGIARAARAEITVNYRGHILDTGYIADFICYEDTLVLVASVAQFERSHDLQLINHLKCTGLRRGLYLNFSMDRVEFRRIVAPGQRERS